MLQESERRDFVRAPIAKTGSLVMQYQQPGKGKPEPVAVKIEDISLSGVRFSCFELYRKGDICLLTFIPMDNFKAISICCTVGRTYKDEFDRRHYGCRISDPLEENLDELSKMIFRLQLIQRGSGKRY